MRMDDVEHEKITTGSSKVNVQINLTNSNGNQMGRYSNSNGVGSSGSPYQTSNNHKIEGRHSNAPGQHSPQKI